MLECLLALDIGTSSLKAAVYSLKGELLAGEAVSYPMASPQPGWAEQDPLEWWKACCLVCQKISRKGAFHVLAISVSGQAPGCVPIDRHGQPIRPAILWLDRRADAQAKWLRAMPALQQDLNRLDSYFGGVKWLWYRQNEPENYSATWKILQANGYIIQRLTGETSIDPGHAAICSPCFDSENRTWSQSMCDRMDLDVEKLPSIHPASAVIGSLSKLAARETGLTAGTPVVCGSADFICSFLGSGCAGASSAALMLGTAGNLMVLAPPRLDTRMLNTYHIDGQVLSTGGVLAGGAVNWFLGVVGSGQQDLLPELENEAAHVPPGAQGLVFLPYLMGERSPIWDPNARGVYIGLSVQHQRAHLYRALLEGVAFAFRQLLEIHQANGVQIEDVVVINGGSRNTLWRQIIADVLDLPLRYHAGKDGTSLGAAYIAAMGIGIFDRTDQISSWLGMPQEILPNSSTRPVYQRNFGVYAGLYEQLREHFLALQTP